MGSQKVRYIVVCRELERVEQTLKKIIVAALIIGIFLVYSFTYGHTAALLPGSAASSKSSDRSATSVPVTGTVPAITPTTASTNGAITPTAPSTNGALYKDGAYTGSVADAQWGNIQVKAIIKNGKITDVQFLQYPNERNRSVEINNYADPQLTSEAIQAQSANVDTISGATDTSDAFIQSLSDALALAKTGQ